MQSVCVYCGSSPGVRAEYQHAAEALADQLVARDLGLVYGGAHVGLMGSIADRVLARGGSVTGVIPRALVDLEVAHESLTSLEVVPDMHARKARMAELADGFIAMPGGLGTLEELFEMLTWSQLGFHAKPVGLLNMAGFYDQLLAFLDHAAAEGFMRVEHRELLLSAESADNLLTSLMAWRAVALPKLSRSIST
jgi:uncharacterized protein (TIGR00730 family)